MERILLAYSTVDGHTREIVARIAEIYQAEGCETTLHSFDEGAGRPVAEFDRVIVGASIRYGKHRPNVGDWINANAAELAARPSAFFSVNLVARKPGRDKVETNNYVKKFLDSIDWQPQQVGIFAGKLEYPKYGFWDRQAIRLIMLMTKGPTDPTAVVEFTDWEKVERFARDVLALPRQGA
jgi:menaquinone-dependent protoporphyrinogen oxidase